MDDERPRLFAAEGPVTYLLPTRAELVRYFAWGYLSRRELSARLRDIEAEANDDDDNAAA
jgi:hypothetical protein